MTLLVHAGYQLSTRTGVVLGPDGRPVGRIVRASFNPQVWWWRAHNHPGGFAKTRTAALAALTAHLEQEAAT